MKLTLKYYIVDIKNMLFTLFLYEGGGIGKKRVHKDVLLQKVFKKMGMNMIPIQRSCHHHSPLTIG